MASVLQNYISSSSRNATDSNQTHYKIRDFIDSLSPSGDIVEVLKLPDLKIDVLKKFGVVQNIGKHTLHFPLKNVAGICTGEKILNYDRNFEEETVPSEKCSGVLCHTNGKATKAILVLSVMDFLALCTQKFDECK